MWRVNKILECKRSVLIVVLALMLCACGSGQNDRELVQSAKNYIAKQQVRAAALELKNALQRNANNAEARYLLGTIELEAGDAASAEKEFRRASKLGWNNAQSQLELAKALLVQRKFKQIVTSIKAGDDWSKMEKANLLGLQAGAEADRGNLGQATKILVTARRYQPDALQVLITAVQLQLLDHAVSKANDAVRRALKKYPDNPQLLLLGANAAVRARNSASAGNFYHRIIAAEPSGLVTRMGRKARLGDARLNIIEKNYAQAKKILAPLIKQNPGDLTLNYVLATLAFEKKDYAEAEIHLRKILKVAPDHKPTLLLFGTVNYVKGDYEQAAYSLSRYVAARPDNLYARKLLGRTYLALQQPEKARTALHIAANDAESKDAELLGLAGLSAVQSGQIEAGVRELEKAVNLSPKNNVLRSELANAYIAKGATDQALIELKKVIASGQRGERAKIMVIFAYLRDKKFNQAIQFTQNILNKQPDNATLINIMGVVQYMSGHLKKGRQYFEKTLQMDPGNTAALINLARLDEKTGEVKKAERIYRKIISAAPKNATVLMALAGLAEKRGEKQQQIKWLEKIRSVDKKNIAARVTLAEYFIQTKNFIQVKQLLNEMEAEHKGQAVIAVVRAEFLIATKSYNQAMSVIRKLIKTHPKAYVGYYLKGLNELKMRQQQAESSLNKAYQLNPESIQSAVLLAQIKLKSHDFKAALVLGKHIKQLLPTKALGAVIMGDAAMGLHQYPQAMQAYDAAWQFDQTRNLVLRRLHASQKIYSGDRAYTAVTDWLAQHPHDTLMRFRLAGIYQQGGHVKQAMQQYESIIKRHPENVAALNNLAWLYNQNRDSRALEYAKRAFKLSGSAAIKDTYGWILLKNHKDKQALELLTDAVKALPDVADVKYHYAVAVYTSGDRQTAIALLKKLLKSDVAFDGRAAARSLVNSQ